MNPKISPKQASKNIDLFMKDVDELLKTSYKEGYNEKNRLNTRIEGFIRAAFKDDNEKLDDYRFELDHAYAAVSGVEDSEEEKQKMYIEDLEIMKNYLMAYKDELTLILDSEGCLECNINKSPNESFNSVAHVNVNGNVGNLALGDINTYNTSIYLNALIKAIEESEEIPLEQKKNLIDKIKDVANNDYIKSIGSGLILI